MSEQDPNRTPADEPRPSIYLGADGGYHDDTEENRERFPAAEAVQEAPTEPDSGTLIEAGEATGSDDTPVPSEPAPKPEDSTK